MFQNFLDGIPPQLIIEAIIILIFVTFEDAFDKYIESIEDKQKKRVYKAIYDVLCSCYVILIIGYMLTSMVLICTT